jgi:autotransporter-associated beta strand protein
VQVGDVSGVNSALLVSGLKAGAGGVLGNNITVPSGSAGSVQIGDLGAGNSSGFYYSGGITLNRNVWLVNGLVGSGGGAFSGNITDAAGTANTVSLITSGGAAGTVVENISGAGNTWGGGTIMDGGVWAVSSASSSLGTGGLTVNGGELRLIAAGNLASGKTALVNSGGMLSVTNVFNPTSLIAAASSGALGIDVASYSTALNMANIGNGSMFLGGVGGTYTATSLTVGSGNTYRLGAGGGTASTSALKISGVNNVLTGNAALVVGSTLSTAPYVEGNGWVTLSNANNYTGGTTINAASTLDAQLLTAGATALGSTTAAVNLNAGALQLITNVAATSTTIGALNFNGGSELAFNTATTATNAFTVGSLARSNNGVIAITDVASAAALGGVAQIYSSVAPATDTTGMTAAYFFDPTGDTYLTYGATGFADIGTTATVTTGSNVKTTVAAAITANTAVNSLVLGNSITSTAGPWTLTVGSSGSTAGIAAYTNSSTIGSATAANNINLTFGTTGTAEGILYAATSGKTLTVDAGIAGSGGLTIAGPGIVNLSPTSGTNSFTGQVTINGEVTANADGDFGNTSNVVVINGGILQLAQNASLASASRTISVGANGATIQTVSPNGTSADTIASQITGSGAFLVFNTANTNSNPSWVFTLTNSANNFTAPIYIDQLNNSVNGFTLSIGADSELGNAANAVNISAGATLQITASTSGTRSFNLDNGGGVFDVTSSAGAANKYTIGGVVAGDGNLNKISSGGLAAGGILELTAANTLTGNTVVTGGSVLLGNALALQFSTVGVGVNGGLTFDPSIGTFTIGGLGGSGNVTLADTSSSAVTLGVGNNNSNINYSGVLSGAGGLTKIGTGTQTLSGANTYTGTTTVSAGTLIVSGSISGSPAVNLNATGTLLIAGAGQYTNLVNSAANLTLGATAGGTLAMKNDGTNTSGTQSLQTFANLTLDNNSTIDLGSNTTGDGNTLLFTGATSLTGYVSLKITDWSGTPYSAGTLTDSGSSLTQDYLLFASDPTFSALGVLNSSISFYNDSGVFIGNGMEVTDTANGDIELVAAIPEPGAYASILSGIAILAVWRRARRGASNPFARKSSI